MIFKGNTKMTPALTELLDDTTPSSNKTYSSEKIESIIDVKGTIPFLKITKNEIQALLKENITPLSSTNLQSIIFEINRDNFTIINNINDEDINKYNYIAISSGATSNPITTTINKQAGVSGMVFVRQNAIMTYQYMLNYPANRYDQVWANFNGVFGVDKNNLLTTSENSTITSTLNYSQFSSNALTINLIRNYIIDTLPKEIIIYAYPSTIE